MSIKHDECNVYCTDTEHCDLVYAGDATETKTRWEVATAYRLEYGVVVTRMERAAEAGPLSELPESDLESIGADDRLIDDQRWLVWWRHPDPGHAGPPVSKLDLLAPDL